MNRISRVVVVCSLMIAFLLLVLSRSNDSRSLQGVWAVESMQILGISARVKDPMRLVVSRNRLIVRGMGDEEEWSYKIDASHLPKHLDLISTQGEKPILAIYEVDGDELKICFPKLPKGGVCEKRPTTFGTGVFSETVLWVLSKSNHNGNAELNNAADSR